MEKKIDLVKIKEQFPYNYHDIVIERHEKAKIIDIKDSVSIPVLDVQNPKAFYSSFYKPLTRFI